MDKDFLKIAERLFSKRTKSFFLSQAYNRKIAERFLLKGISPTTTDTPQRGCRSTMHKYTASYTQLPTPTAKKGKHLFLCELDLLGGYEAVVAATEGAVVDVDLILVLGLVEVALGRGGLPHPTAVGDP